MMYFSQNENKNYSFDQLKKVKNISSHDEAIKNGYIPFDLERLAPPKISIYEEVFNAGTRVENGKAYIIWEIKKLDNKMIEKIFNDKFKQSLENYFNEVAKANGYDDVASALLRAKFDGPYKKDGMLFSEWVAMCHKTFSQIIEKIQTGDISRAPESWEQIKQTLPIFKK